jgi:hypothetical protein
MRRSSARNSAHIMPTSLRGLTPSVANGRLPVVPAGTFSRRAMLCAFSHTTTPKTPYAHASWRSGPVRILNSLLHRCLNARDHYAKPSLNLAYWWAFGRHAADAAGHWPPAHVKKPDSSRRVSCSRPDHPAAVSMRQPKCLQRKGEVLFQGGMRLSPVEHESHLRSPGILLGRLPSVSGRGKHR